MKSKLVLRLVLCAASLLMASLFAGGLQAQTLKVRSVHDGRWNDPGIWERWNGAQWTPLLPNQYPGCRTMRDVHVQVDHKVYLPVGLEIHVTQVSATNQENLLVDGILQVDLQSNDIDSAASGISNPAPGARPDRESGITVAPNPLYAKDGSGAVAITFTITEELQAPRLRLYDESGLVVRELQEWGRLSPGTYTVKESITEISSGTYHVSLEAAGLRRSQTVTVVK